MCTAVELVQDLSEYLSRRFPTVYTVVRHNATTSGKDRSGWYGRALVKQITILPLGKTYDLDDEDPMVVAASLCAHLLLYEKTLVLLIHRP